MDQGIKLLKVIRNKRQRCLNFVYQLFKFIFNYGIMIIIYTCIINKQFYLVKFDLINVYIKFCI
jgi:hypothetical protein